MSVKHFAVIFLCLMTSLLLSGCQNSSEKRESVSASSNSVSSSNEESLLPTPSSSENEDLEEKLFGYYSDGLDTFIRITQDSYEEKSLASGLVNISINIDHILCDKLESGTIQYKIVPADTTYDPLYFTLNADGDLRNEFSVLQVITPQQYDSLEPLSNDDPVEESSTSEDVPMHEFTEEIPWYEKEFRSYQVMSDLSNIDNLFAVGKSDEAVAMIQEKIFGSIETAIDQYLPERQYWKAQNYVAMFQAYLNPNSSNYGVSFPYVEEYFDNHYGSYGSGIFEATQPYLDKIAEVASGDSNVISYQDSIYLLNQFLLDHQQSTAMALFHKTDCYFYFLDIVNNGSVTDYIIVDPFTQEVYTMPRSYFFIDGSILA